MKMLLVAIFALSCAQIFNVVSTSCGSQTTAYTTTVDPTSECSTTTTSESTTNAKTTTTTRITDTANPESTITITTTTEFVNTTKTTSTTTITTVSTNGESPTTKIRTWYLPDYTTPPHRIMKTEDNTWFPPEYTTPPHTSLETRDNGLYLPDYTTPPYTTTTETEDNTWFPTDYTTPPYTRMETAGNDWYLPEYTALMHTEPESPTPVSPTLIWSPDESTTLEPPTTESPTTESPTTESRTPVYPTLIWPTPEATTPEPPTPEPSTTESRTPVYPTLIWPTPESPTLESTTLESPTTESRTPVSPTLIWPTLESTTPESPTTESQTPVSPTLIWPNPESTTPELPTPELTTPESPTTKLTTTSSPYPSNDYDPIEEMNTCGFKYGVPASKRQFRYVAFLKNKAARTVQYCSGSLIHPRWVLTSAYCILPSSDLTVEVTLGALVPFDKEDPDRVVVQSDEIYVHPGYLPVYKNPKNDVALIKLPMPVTSAAIIPVDLKRDSAIIPKGNIIFAGWGEVGYETLTFTETMAIFEGPCKCLSTDSTTKRDEKVAGDSEFFCCISEDFFCFIHNGAGLIVDGALVGVLSTRCFPHCRHHEGIFTNIYNHLQWIDDTVNADLVEDSNPGVYRACSDIPGFASGVYLIQPNDDVEPFEVFCDLRVDGEKWTVIQQRFNKSVDFYRNYANYTKGFGPIDGNHWLGLEKIHQITKDGEHELLVEIEAHNSTSGYAQYSTVKVGSKETGFLLIIFGYSGTAGDSMTYSNGKWNLNGMKFSTFDNDQDEAWSNCADYYQGAWWYNQCSLSNLNGPYYDTAVYEGTTTFWEYNFGWYALKYSRMMVRRKSYKN